MPSPELFPLLSVQSVPMLLIPLWGYSYLLLFELLFPWHQCDNIYFFFFLSPSWANWFFPGLVSCFHCQPLELLRYLEQSCAVSHPVIKPKVSTMLLLQFAAYLWMLQYVTHPASIDNCEIKILRPAMLLWAVSAEKERVSKIMCCLTSGCS